MTEVDPRFPEEALSGDAVPDPWEPVAATPPVIETLRAEPDEELPPGLAAQISKNLADPSKGTRRVLPEVPHA